MADLRRHLGASICFPVAFARTKGPAQSGGTRWCFSLLASIGRPGLRQKVPMFEWIPGPENIVETFLSSFGV